MHSNREKVKRIVFVGDYCNTKVVQSNSQHYQTSRYPHPVYEQCLNVPLYEINQALSYGHP